MTAKETELINSIKAIPSINAYGYKLESDLLITIANVMGYKISTEYRHYGIYKHLANREEYYKALKILNGLKEKNIIKFSKAGTSFKVLV